MRIVCDLHLHSRYSLATSPSLDLTSLAVAGRRVGIDLLAAPDFTHPLWRDEMRSELTETGIGSGVYSWRGRHFLLMSEVSCIWKHTGKSRRVHLLVAAPDFEAVDTMCRSFEDLQNLESDGRPIFKISTRELFEIVRDADPRCEVIPAHVFTPWYGVFGAKSGFDSLEECFDDVVGEIAAVETGLSSDPSMHWSVPDSKRRSIVSFSDAHSVASLGRESTMIDVEELTYDGAIKSLRERNIIETYEFHPEHGKYHHDGHRKCVVRMHPSESDSVGGVCPICQCPMTLGVLNRAESISDGDAVQPVKDDDGRLVHPSGRYAPYRHLVPLAEILAYTLVVGKTSKRVKRAYDALIDAIGSEYDVLLRATVDDITRVVETPEIADAIMNARHGNVTVDPGYDGVYGSAIPGRPAPETSVKTAHS